MSNHPSQQAERFDIPGSPRDSQMRIEALKQGRDQFGHGGTHKGFGSAGEPGCPKWSHHHHDPYCQMPSKAECEAAGVPYREPHEWGKR